MSNPYWFCNLTGFVTLLLKENLKANKFSMSQDSYIHVVAVVTDLVFLQGCS